MPDQVAQLLDKFKSKLEHLKSDNTYLKYRAETQWSELHLRDMELKTAKAEADKTAMEKERDIAVKYNEELLRLKRESYAGPVGDSGPDRRVPGRWGSQSDKWTQCVVDPRAAGLGPDPEGYQPWPRSAAFRVADKGVQCVPYSSFARVLTVDEAIGDRFPVGVRTGRWVEGPAGGGSSSSGGSSGTASNARGARVDSGGCLVEQPPPSPSQRSAATSTGGEENSPPEHSRSLALSAFSATSSTRTAPSGAEAFREGGGGTLAHLLALTEPCKTTFVDQENGLRLDNWLHAADDYWNSGVSLRKTWDAFLPEDAPTLQKAKIDDAVKDDLRVREFDIRMFFFPVRFSLFFVHHRNCVKEVCFFSREDDERTGSNKSTDRE